VDVVRDREHELHELREVVVCGRLRVYLAINDSQARLLAGTHAAIRR